MKIIKEFNYSIRPEKMLLPLLLFGAAAAFFFRQAITNSRGLIINGIIELNTAQGTIFYYVMAGLSCLFVLAAGAAIVNGLLVKKKLIIYSDGLLLPVRKDTARLFFADIVSAQVLDIYGTRIIELVTKENKKYSIPDSVLGTKTEFNTVFTLISENTRNTGT